MAKIWEIDFSLDFLSRAVKQGEMDMCRARMALTSAPEKMAPLMSEAIEQGNEDVFLFFVENKFPYKTTDKGYANLWDELVARDKTQLVESVLNYRKSIASMTDLNAMKQALEKHRISIRQNMKGFLYQKRLQEKIGAIQNKIMAASCNVIDSCEIVDAAEGDFPAIMLAAAHHTTYRFDGLRRDKIEQKGLPTYLLECLEKHVKDVEKSAVSENEKTKWVLEQLKTDDEDIFENEPVSKLEAAEFHKKVENDKSSFYKAEIEKSAAFYDLYQDFCASENAPLAQLFEKQGKTMVLFKDEGQSARGQRFDDFVVLANIAYATLHHELIHNVDENGALSDSPFFQKMYTYAKEKMEKEEIAAFFGRKSFWGMMSNASHKYKDYSFVREMLPFFATYSCEYPQMAKPTFVHNALRVVNAYAAACVSGNVSEQNRILAALQKDDMPATVKDFDAHLKSILKPVKTTHIRGLLTNRNDLQR